MKKPSTRAEIIADLQYLVIALDQRLPRLGELGEPAIAEESAELREKTVALLAKLRALPSEEPEAQSNTA